MFWMSPVWSEFEGHFKSNCSLISLEHQPLEVVRPSLLASEPSSTSSTYTLIGPWCRSMLKTHLKAFLKLLFLESCVMSGAFGEHCPFYKVVLWCSIFSLLLTWATCGGDHHYWIIFKRLSILSKKIPTSWGLWLRLPAPLTTFQPN
jgi:hypothetical protein